MNTIFKFPVSIDDYQEISMPIHSKILSVQVQYESIQLWVLCDENKLYENRKFRLSGTGHLIIEDSNKLEFIGTVQLQAGTLVFHLFEVKE